MKRIVALLLTVFMIAGVFYACSGNIQNTEYDEETSNIYQETTEAQETEETTQSTPLSEECDLVLARGTDLSGNEYELIANQEETYDSVTIKMGVIKNNEWLVEPTEDIPFIDQKSGLIMTGYGNVGVDKLPKYDDYCVKDYKYVADGCFYADVKNEGGFHDGVGIVYNAENGKSFYMTNDNGKYEGSKIVYGKQSQTTCYGKHLVVERMIERSGSKNEVDILDTDTMQLKTVIKETEWSVQGPVSDGLFALGYSYGNSVLYFYDTSGNQVIDLTSYDEWGVKAVEPTYRSFFQSYFIDGKFAFKKSNNAGTEFAVYIDKTGKVIDSKKNEN